MNRNDLVVLTGTIAITAALTFVVFNFWSLQVYLMKGDAGWTGGVISGETIMILGTIIFSFVCGAIPTLFANHFLESVWSERINVVLVTVTFMLTLTLRGSLPIFDPAILFVTVCAFLSSLFMYSMVRCVAKI